MEDKAAIAAIDPVCRMRVSVKWTMPTSSCNGKTYYFCSPGYHEQFERDPEAILGEAAAQPMHNTLQAGD